MSTWTVLGIGWVTAALLMTSVWLLSLVRRDASVIDIFWGFGFVVLAWVYLLQADQPTWRGRAVVALVSLWGLRLSLHLLRRNWGKPEDYRYREMRRRWGARFPLLSLPGVFWLQATLLWVVALPLFQVQRSPEPASFTWLDGLGAFLFACGLFFEAVGDWQLARFRGKPENQGRVLDSGLWNYTRHPNYFGDALVWWGFGCFALATPGSLWTVTGPILMTYFLRRVSGVTLLEEKLRRTRPGYVEYVRRTNAFFPWLPRGRNRGTS